MMACSLKPQPVARYIESVAADYCTAITNSGKTQHIDDIIRKCSIRIRCSAYDTAVLFLKASAIVYNIPHRNMSRLRVPERVVRSMYSNLNIITCVCFFAFGKCHAAMNLPLRPLMPLGRIFTGADVERTFYAVLRIISINFTSCSTPSS